MEGDNTLWCSSLFILDSILGLSELRMTYPIPFAAHNLD